MITPTPSAHSGEQGKPSDRELLDEALDLLCGCAPVAWTYQTPSDAAEYEKRVTAFVTRARELERKHEQSGPVGADLREACRLLAHAQVSGADVSRAMATYERAATPIVAVNRAGMQCVLQEFVARCLSAPPPSEQAGISDEAAKAALRAYNDQSMQHNDAPYVCMRAALQWYESAFPRGVGSEPVEMSPEFTDTARGAIAWVLYHHQGGNSAIGQPLRFALGMGAHEPLRETLIADAIRYSKWAKATTADFNAHPAHPAPEAQAEGEKPVAWRKTDSAGRTDFWTLDPESHYGTRGAEPLYLHSPTERQRNTECGERVIECEGCGAVQLARLRTRHERQWRFRVRNLLSEVEGGRVNLSDKNVAEARAMVPALVDGVFAKLVRDLLVRKAEQVFDEIIEQLRADAAIAAQRKEGE